MNRSTPGLPVHHQLQEFTQTHVHRVRDAIQPSHPLLSPSPLAPNPSQHQGLFQWVNSSHEVAKVLEFQIQHHSIQRNPGQISFRMDWLDLLAVQGTLKSLLQHHSSKASIVQRSAFFTVQLSHPCKSTRVTLVPLVTLFLHVQVQPSSLPTLTLDDDSAIEMAKVAIMEISRNSKIFLFQSTTRLQRKDIETYFEQWTMCPAC